MDRATALARFQEEIRRETPGVSTSFPGYVRVVADGWALVTGTTLAKEDVEAAIQSEVEFFRDLNREFEWKVYSWDTPSTLKESLRARGFLKGDEEAIMVFDLDQDIDSWGIDVRQSTIKVSTHAHLEDYRRVERELGSESSYLNEVIESLQRGTTDAMAFVAYRDEQPVSIARLHCHHGSLFGGCYGGSTLPEFRKMGFYRALVLARAHEAKKLGVQYLQVDSLPTSRPILERLGFVQIGSTWPLIWSPD